jgi:O-glycosyl hydrolase
MPLRFGMLLVLAATVTADAASNTARAYLTTTDEQTLFALQPPVVLKQPVASPTIRITTDTLYQRMVGFGAAITDASAYVLHSSPPTLYNSIMELLFTPFPRQPPVAPTMCEDQDAGCAAAIDGGLLSCATDLCPTCPKAGLCNKTCGFCKSAADLGLGISVVRVPMGVSDFSVSYAAGNVTYADTPNDWNLAHFSTAHDDAYILPVLRQARKLNPDLRIIASPWTAPMWLKDPPGSIPDQIGGGTLLNTTQAYDTYAEYFLRFVQDYASKGVTVDYLTLQNEPGHGGCGTMPCMLLPEESEARLAILVGKKLAAAGLANTTRILGYDHNWGNNGDPSQPGPEYPTALLNDTAASQYIAGVA